MDVQRVGPVPAGHVEPRPPQVLARATARIANADSTGKKERRSIRVLCLPMALALPLRHRISARPAVQLADQLNILSVQTYNVSQLVGRAAAHSAASVPAVLIRQMPGNGTTRQIPRH
jgi:hypothetical protein